MKDESLRTSFPGDAAGTDAPALRSEMPVVDELCSLLVAHGVKDAVLCPGSRNIPIVGTLSKIPGMRTGSSSARDVPPWCAAPQAPHSSTSTPPSPRPFTRGSP